MKVGDITLGQLAIGTQILFQFFSVYIKHAPYIVAFCHYIGHIRHESYNRKLLKHIKWPLDPHKLVEM